MAELQKSLNKKNSLSLFQSANEVIPGGVNSPVRAFKSVGGNPIFMSSAKGAWLTDADGNKYIDLINSWGPMILGHAVPEIVEAVNEAAAKSFSFGTPTSAEVDMAELIVDMVPSVELVRMVNSGTEATMSAIRLARGFTGRDKIIKFSGHYHGHGDSFLIAAGSGALTFGIPNSPGVTEGTAKDTLTAEFNDLAGVEALVSNNEDQIAAIILEPVTGNMGVVKPEAGFLEGLRSLCDRAGIVLIFDEVMTGFRLSKGGAQERLGVMPDITTLGKIIGGGMPVGAYGGRKDIMNYVSPVGPVYQAGTLSGNPVAMAAGKAMLNILNSRPEIYTELEKTSIEIAHGLRNILIESGIPFRINHLGSMMTIFFREGKVNSFDDAKGTDTEVFGKFFRNMLDRGVYLPPSAFESWFISSAIGKSEIDQILSATRDSLKQL